MVSIEEEVLANGLPLARLGMAGTQATTVFVAFDAGARAEQAQENGIAHFLEHLVFRGGERYPTHRDVIGGAERLGAALGAHTTHDLVAFYVTCRAEAVMEATDLLTDILSSASIGADELERERGVVIQEIAQHHDQPQRVVASMLDRAAYGDHPLGRPILGPRQHLERFTREQVVGFRERRWTPARGAAYVVGDLSRIEPQRLEELFLRLPARAGGDGLEQAPASQRRVLVEPRETNQSHLRLLWPAAVDARDPARRAAFSVYTTLLGGSMGSRLFDEIREQRGLCYSIWARGELHADTAALRVGAGLESAKCLEAYERILEIVTDLAADGPGDEELQRARAYAAGSLVRSLERSMAVAGRAAERRITFDESGSPLDAIAALDAVTDAEVREVARCIAGAPTVACLGPHEDASFA